MKTTVQLTVQYSIEHDTPHALRRAIADLKRCPLVQSEVYSGNGFYMYKRLRGGRRVVKGASK